MSFLVFQFSALETVSIFGALRVAFFFFFFAAFFFAMLLSPPYRMSRIQAPPGL